MATSAGDLKISVNVDFSGLKSQLKNVESAASKSAAKLKQTFNKMAAAATKAVLAIGAAFAAVTALSIKAAMKQEDALFGLQAALSNTGDATKSAMKDFAKFAAEIQKVTRFGDEEVLALMSLQKNLGVASKDLKMATEMSIGLAAATGRGAESMAMYVALALQGETTMLRRYIPALRSASSKTEELAIITKFAANGFKIAQAAAETTSGKIKQMKNAIGDAAEAFGAPFLDPLKEMADKLKAFAKNNGEQFEEWGNKVVASMEGVIKGFGKLIDKLGGIESALSKIKTVLTVILGLVVFTVLTKAIVGIIATFAVWHGWIASIGVALASIGGGSMLAGLAAIIATIGTAVIALVAALTAAFMIIKKISEIHKAMTSGGGALSGGKGFANIEAKLAEQEAAKAAGTFVPKSALSGGKAATDAAKQIKKEAKEAALALKDRIAFEEELNEKLKIRHKNTLRLKQIEQLAFNLGFNKDLLKGREATSRTQQALLGSAISEGARSFRGVTSAGSAVALSGRELFGGQARLSADANAITKEIRILRQAVERQAAEKERLEKIDTGAGELVTPQPAF